MRSCITKVFSLKLVISPTIWLVAMEASSMEADNSSDVAELASANWFTESALYKSSDRFSSTL